MKNKFINFCLLILITNTSYGQTIVKEFRLDNGLQILVKEDHRAPAAIVQLWYKVGSSYEPNGLTGISHALEHMMFKGSKNYPAGKYEQLISSHGGDHNAFTHRDFTSYYVKITAKELPLIFQLEADRMQNALLTAEAFKQEQKVIIEERLFRTEDQPIAKAEENFNVTAFATNGYHQPVIGWMADINALTSDDLRQWYHTWYQPNNAILVIVGDVLAKDVYALAEQYFAAIPAKPIEFIKPRKMLPELGERRITLKLANSVPHVFIGYNVPSVSTAEQPWEPYALDILAYLLAGNDNSRLSKTLIRNLELAAKIDASYSPYSLHATLLLLETTAMPNKNLASLEQVIFQELQTLQTQQISATELATAKTQIIANQIYAQDSMFTQAFELGALTATGYRWQEIDNYIKGIKTVSTAQIQAVANKFLTKSNSTIAYLQPE